MIPLLLSLALAQSADRPGRWYPADSELGRLQALGYVGASEPASGAPGVRIHDADRVQPGLTLVSTGACPCARLIDAEGRVVQRWQGHFLEAFPDRREHAHLDGAQSWRRVAPTPDGGLLAIHEGIGLVRLDRDSRLLWALPNGAHHDLEVLPDGRIWVLAREAHDRWSGKPILEDFLVELSPRGEELRRVSLLRALDRSPFAALAHGALPWDTGDLLHTNSVQRLPFDGNHPAFQEGRVLLSSRTRDLLYLLDWDQGVVWASRGPWSRQHDAELVSPDRLLLFDNRGLGEHASRVLALAPGTDRILDAWGGTAALPLHSDVLGAVQALPNGNLLITESTHGRALELAPDGTVVWEYRNPDEADGLVAALFEALRLP